MIAMQGSFPGCPIKRSVLADFCPLRGLMVDHSTIEIKMRRLYRFSTVLKSNWKTLIESFWRAKCLLCRTTFHFPLLLSCRGQIRIVVLIQIDESHLQTWTKVKARPPFTSCFWCNSGAAKPRHNNDKGCIASVPLCIKRCVLASRLNICQK